MLAAMEVVQQVWDRAAAVQPPPSDGVLALTALVAAVLVLAPGAWPVARHVVTIVHEGAHGLAAWATGRQLAGIRLHSDTSGVTVSRGRAAGTGMVLTAAAGYPGPALLGLLAAWLLGVGHAVAVLWVLLLEVLGHGDGLPIGKLKLQQQGMVLLTNNAHRE